MLLWNTRSIVRECKEPFVVLVFRGYGDCCVVTGIADSVVCKIAEYAYAVINGKPSFHISFIMNVSPNCDCWGHNDAAIVPDLGIAASFDPVALDCACADLVKAAPSLHGNAISDKDHECCCHHEHEDKFHIVHPDTNWEAGIEHAEKIGLGTADYELITVV